MTKLLPDSIAGRALLVLLAGLMVSHLASTAMYFTEGYAAATLSGDRQLAERMAIFTRLMEKIPPAERQEITPALDSPSVRVAWAKSGTTHDSSEEGSRPHVIGHILGLDLGRPADNSVRVRYAITEAGDDRLAGFGAAEYTGSDAHTDATRRSLRQVAARTRGSGTVEASIRLSDSSWLNFSIPLHEPRTFSSQRFVLSMSIMLLAVIALSVWAVRRLIAPLATFAHAADRLGLDVNAPRLPETGPREVRQAASAFNEMQARIRRFVEDRTQMVAAIAHDLGTPITRLRLRAEYVEDEEQQRKMLADLKEMEDMIVATVSFASDEAVNEPRQTFDLVSLLQSVCDGLTDAGFAVAFQSEGRLPYACRPISLGRAFTNLIENAAKFGEQARVSVVEGQDKVVVRVDDDGPGIPEERHEDVFKPFHRLEHSRSRETGGTGLGLTVARTAVRGHGGDITLGNLPEGGLRVEVTLPR